MRYCYNGDIFRSVDAVMSAVREDIETYFGDSDLDEIICEHGPVRVDGREFRTALSLKRANPDAYDDFRISIIDSIVDGISDCVEEGNLPIRIPYVSNSVETADE